MRKCENLVLLIEDDEDIRSSIKQLLELEGFSVITANNGKEGLECLEQTKYPCLILLDLFMPVMDGNYFLQEITKNSLDTVDCPPVVILSAAPPQEEAVIKAKSKAAGFVRKPIDLERFLKVVEQYCNRDKKAIA
jgi:CheY-like chemotaxis protein